MPDDIIDDAVVRVSPDLTGFRRKLERDLKRQMAGTDTHLNVDVDIDYSDVSKKLHKLAQVWKNGPSLMPFDGKELDKQLGDLSVRIGRIAAAAKTQFTQVRTVAEKLQKDQLAAAKEADAQYIAGLKRRFELGTAGAKATAKAQHDAAAQEIADRNAVIDAFGRQASLQRGAAAAEAKRVAAAKAATAAQAAAEAKRAAEERSNAVARQSADERSMSFHEKVNAELARMARDRADDEVRINRETQDQHRRIEQAGYTQRRVLLAANEAVEKDSIRRVEQAAKESNQRRVNNSRATSVASKIPDGSGLVDFGGSGIRPQNLLIAAAVALSPALLAVASSAAQASTAIAAVGAASIGTGLAITALVVGFSRISDALKLREQVRKEDQRAAASSTENVIAERARAQAIVAANRQIRDSVLDVARAQRDIKSADSDAADARKAVTQAYVDAAQRVKDLRSELESLALQEQQDSLDVAGAREKLDAVNRNFWSTDIEKRQAALDLKKALDRQGNTKDDEAKKKKELNQLDRDGLGQSKEVLAAKKAQVAADRAAADARRALTAAQTREADATQALATAKLRDAQATKSTSAASQDLAAQIAAMSPAARAMYYWFDKNQAMLDKLRAKMEQAVLPGFLHFLEALTSKGKGKSTLELMADSAADLGKVIGDTVGRLGDLTKSKWFRKDFAKISAENLKSFKLLGKAAEILVKPFSAIIAAASPLFTRFSAWIVDLSKKFDAFIQKHVNDGSLVKWFADAGDELGKWADIAKNLLTFLLNVFKASLPSGKDLVSRLGDLTKKLADWSGGAGKKKLEDFFDKVKKFDYQKLAKTVASIVTLLGALKLFSIARDHPLYLILGRLAAKYPKETGDLLTKVADAIIKVVKWADSHPVATAGILGILVALRNAKSVTIGLKMLGLGETALAKLFASVANMTVTAANVTVVGGGKPGAVLPGGKPGKAIPGGVAAGGATEAGILARVTAFAATPAFIVTATAIAAAAMAKLGWDQGASGNTPVSTITKPLVKPTPGNVGSASLMTLSPVYLTAESVAGIWKLGFTKWLDQFQADAGTLKDTLITKLQPVLDWAKALPGKIWDFVKSLPMKFAEFGGNIIGLLIVGVVKGLPALWDMFTGLIGKALGFFVKLGVDVLTWANGLPTKIATIFATLPQKIGTAVKDLPATFAAIWTLVQATFVSGLNYAIDILNSFLKGIDDVTSKFDIHIAHDIHHVGDSPGIGKAIGGIAPKVGAALADGGPVRGNSPHSRADNIPARLTANEYVQPVNAVKKYGVSFMDSVRNGTYKDGAFADGGLVNAGAKAKGFIKDIIGGVTNKIPSLMSIANTLTGGLAGGLFGGDPGGGSAVGDVGVARIAEATARALGATDKQLLALIEAGIVESGMRNISYGDRDSVGFLQQRAGWGSVAQRMDVAHATRSFIAAAKAKDSVKYTAGQLAQAVQVSAFPDRYQQREADAYAIINREAPGISGGNVPSAGGSFGAWPPSAASVHGHDSGVWRKIIQLVAPTGLDRHSYGDLYNNRRTDNGGWSWHAGGRAVDFGGYNQDKLAQFFEARKPSVLELIHSTKNANYGIQRGRDHDMGHEFGLHKNHLHVAMAGGGLVPRAYDSGGTLAPGLTVAYNGTGQNETVRTAAQEKALRAGGTMRLDPRDLALMAQHIAIASAGQTITMDGRKVAETVAAYNYLHGGV